MLERRSWKIQWHLQQFTGMVSLKNKCGLVAQLDRASAS